MSKHLPDFAGLFCLAFFLISIFTIGDSLLRDGDPFWHIKVGSVMLENQNLIDSDVFSHTAFGSPWTAHEWLSEIIMASVYRLAGLEGMLCFFLLIASLSFWLLFKITEKYSNQWVAFGCVSLSLVFSPSHLLARPHLFTWLFMLITLSILTTGGKRLYWLPIVIMLWANLHGGFILGLVLQAIFIIGSALESQLSLKKSVSEILQQQKAAAIVLLASLFAVGMNPFGYELLIFPFQVSKGVFSTMIGEWQSPDMQDWWYFRVFLIALVLLISFAKSRVTWTERLLIVFFLNAALTHKRHISLMLMALTPCIARMVEIQLENWSHRFIKIEGKKQLQLSERTGPLATVMIALALIICGSIDQRTLNFLTPKNIIGVEREHLDPLVGYLDGNLPDGRMFNEYVLGGYLLYALSPPPKVFIDGRADMYGEEIMKDYNSIVSSGADREKTLEKYNIEWVVFKKDSDLISALKKTGSWQSIYVNDHYEVLKENLQADQNGSVQRE